MSFSNGVIQQKDTKMSQLIINSNHLAQLGMGEFDEADLKEVQRIHDQIDLESDLFVSDFGAISSLMSSHKKIEEASDRTHITSLAVQLTDIVDRMKAIENIYFKRQELLLIRIVRSITGPYWLEKKINEQKATSDFGAKLEQAGLDAIQVKKSISNIDAMLRGHDSEERLIRNHIAAGRIYLQENPHAGIPDDEDMSFTNARDRFARRLANLSALLASHEMSYVQLKLSKAQSIDLCDRFTEVSEVLIPIWSHYQNTLKAGDRNSPEALASANKVHEALVQSLAKTTSKMMSISTAKVGVDNSTERSK